MSVCRWATQGLDFLTVVCDPKFLTYLSEDEFAVRLQLSMCTLTLYVCKCMSDVAGERIRTWKQESLNSSLMVTHALHFSREELCAVHLCRQVYFLVPPFFPLLQMHTLFQKMIDMRGSVLI